METRTYRAAPSAYVVFATITGALSVLWLAAMWRGGAPWLPLLVPLGGFGLVVLWLSRFRLTFGPEEILVAQPFRRVRVARRDVLSVEFAEETGRNEAPLVLCIRTSVGEELRLNAKVFSTEAIQQLLAVPSLNSPRS